jgi:hypothetical protein
MGGGLMQLVAYGAQDVYLTGNPQITFFKVVYRRHTNFSIEMDELPVDTAKPSGTFTVPILRNADLAGKMYLKLRTPALSCGSSSSFAPFNADPVLNTKVAWVRRLGHACVKSFKIQVGGTDVDKHVGVWLDLWYELTHTASQERGYNKMIGDVPEMTTLSGAAAEGQSEPAVAPYTMYIPLQFWFNRNPGLALPLIALQYHDVRLYVELEDLNKLIVWSGAAAPNYNVVNSYEKAGLMVDYIYLDAEERRRFAQVGHEYLIEQVQFPGEDSVNGTMSSSVTSKTKLNFNHPCKELVWALKCGAFNGEGNRFGTNARGRFLGYTDNDSQWGSVLDYAAANLAYGSLVPVGGTAPSGASLTAVTRAGSLSAGDSDVVSVNCTTSTGKTVVMSITLVNATEDDVTSGTRTYARFIDNPLVKNSVNLLDSLARTTTATPNALVSVTITVTAVSGGAPSVTRVESNVVATGHALTLRDVSVPVKDWTDCRYVLGSGVVNPWDVAVIQPSNYGLRLDGAGNPVASGNIQLNGHDRFDICEGSYFNYVQPSQHHTRTPADGVNVYSFGLHPEQHQPAGTANLSRIDTTILNLTFSDPFRANKSVPELDFLKDSKFYTFVTNYNVFRVMSGMGGIAYNN